MKLNDKSLAKYAISGAPADKEGYLSKRGELNKGFQKRWFILKGNLLFYFEKRVDKEPIGIIILEQCRIELAEHADGFVFQIVFPGGSSRIYILGAESQEEMESWMKVLSCASYDYMRLMVTDLQRQLKELSSEAEKKLIDEAKRDSTLLLTTYLRKEIKEHDSGFGGNSRSSRSNPFNTTDSALLELDSEGKTSDKLIDFSEINSMRNDFRKKTKSFLELHDEYGKQIKKFGETWARLSSQQ